MPKPRKPNARTVNFYVGTSGFSYPTWRGHFYPPKWPVHEMLSFYGTRFRAVEINNSFYRAPSASVLKDWARQVPADFRFVLKAPQQITHMQRLKGSEQSLSSLFEAAETLKKRLGSVLFQLPPNFQKDVPRLREFLTLLKSRCRATMEFRHPSWFDDEVFGLLRDHQTGFCIADAEDDLDVPFVATADWGYLRLRRPNYSDSALKTWVARIKKQTWNDCFVFFKHEDTAMGPKLAARLLDVLAGA